MNPLTFVRGAGSVAIKYGVEEAILLDTIVFWARENKSRGENFRDGRWWTYNSLNGLAEIFPWWSQKQIRRIMNSCIAQKALLVGNYNREKRDRTIWYSPSDDLLLIYGEDWTGKCICPNGQMEMPERANGDAQMGTPLPCLNPCSNSMYSPQSPPEGDSKRSLKKKKPKAIPEWQPERFEKFWSSYPRDEDRAKAVEQWDLIPLDRDLMAKYSSEEELLHEMSMGLKRHIDCEDWMEGRGIPYAFRWLRDRKWNEKKKGVHGLKAESSGPAGGQEVHYGWR